MRFVVLFIHLLIGVKCGKLSKEENIKRIEECGKTRLPYSDIEEKYDEGRLVDINKKHWIVSVRSNKFKGIEGEAAGVFISPRHILTSSQPFFDGNFNYHSTGPRNHSRLCRNERDNTHLVADGSGRIESFNVSGGFCNRKKCRKQEYIPITAWFPRSCTDRTRDGFWRMRSLMIVEVEPVVNRTFACLVDKEKFEEKDYSNAYGIETKDSKTSQMKFRIPKDFLYEDEWVMVPKYYSPGDRGGPLIKFGNNNRSIIMGIGASTGFKDFSKWTHFYDLRKFLKVICDITGACSKPEPKTTMAPTTEKATTVPPTVPPETTEVVSTIPQKTTQVIPETSESTPSTSGNETSIDNSTETLLVTTPSKPSEPLNPRKPPVTQKPRTKPVDPIKPEKPEPKDLEQEEEEYDDETEDFIVTEDFFDNGTDKWMITDFVFLSVVLILINA